MRLANDATPDAKVVGEWDANYWATQPERNPQHMAVVQDEWKSSCACCGCPVCAPELTARAAAVGWTWEPAAQWREAVCRGCDTLICEQPRLGVFVHQWTGEKRCGPCLDGTL